MYTFKQNVGEYNIRPVIIVHKFEYKFALIGRRHSPMMRVWRVWRLTSVCLSRTSGLSREQRGLGRLKLAHRQPTSHVTRPPLSRSKGQRSTCRGREHIVAASRAACCSLLCCRWCSKFYKKVSLSTLLSVRRWAVGRVDEKHKVMQMQQQTRRLAIANRSRVCIRVTGLTVSECTWTLSTLEVLRNALYKFKTYLLTYLLDHAPDKGGGRGLIDHHVAFCSLFVKRFEHSCRYLLS